MNKYIIGSHRCLLLGRHLLWQLHIFGMQIEKYMYTFLEKYMQCLHEEQFLCLETQHISKAIELVISTTSIIIIECSIYKTMITVL